MSEGKTWRRGALGVGMAVLAFVVVRSAIIVEPEPLYPTTPVPTEATGAGVSRKQTISPVTPAPPIDPATQGQAGTAEECQGGSCRKRPPPLTSCNSTIGSNSEYCSELDRLIWNELEDTREGVVPGGRLGASRALRELLVAHHRMHRDVAEGREPPGQRYLVWSLSGGVGNRMQAMVSTFLLSLLSRRVLLLSDWFAVTRKKGVPDPKTPSKRHPRLFLEPLSPPSNRPHNNELLCDALPGMHLRDFKKLYPSHFNDRDHHVKIDIISKHDRTLQHWRPLLCSPPQAFPDNDTRFTYIWSNQYYAPLFFANPHTASEMHRLFPDGDVFGPLSRFLLRPNAEVEKTVQKTLCDTFRSVPRLGGGKLLQPAEEGRAPGVLGLQIRAFREAGMVEMAKEFDGCVRKTGLGDRRIFLASLHRPIRDYYQRTYGKRLLLLEQDARVEQKTGSKEDDIEALADMLLLARTGDYILSPGSTFGSFTAGYHSHLPLQMHSMGLTKCTRLTSSQPCFHSFVRSDKLQRRIAEGHFPCTPHPIPETMMANCMADLSTPFLRRR
eukprot:Sspe_Gene.15892::Locus_5548_Transcript_1_1_Confidence_1.000_Length_1751::g.15892::m.15892/K13681/FUT; xyloglucan fucosyltransferase